MSSLEFFRRLQQTERPLTLATSGRPAHSYADLRRDVVALSVRLVEVVREPEVLVLCRDRYAFCVALLATWQAQRVAVLPAASWTAQDLAAHAVLTDEPIDPPAAVQLDVGAWLRAPRIVQSAAPGMAPSEQRLVVPSDDQVLVRLHTSGSTGPSSSWPKTARQLLSEALAMGRHFALTQNDCVVSTVPPQHIYGLLHGVLAPLAAGSRLASPVPVHAPALGQLLDASQASVLVSVPAHLAAIAALSDSERMAQGHVRVVSSGAALDPATASALRAQGSRSVTEVLGSTETGGIAFRTPGDGGRWRPFPEVTVQRSRDGSLHVHSPFVADPERGFTAADRIVLHADGSFEHLGRSDDVVKVGAKRVSVREVEARAKQLDGVDDAKVLAEPRAGLRNHELWLAVESSCLTAEQVRQQLLQVSDPVLVPRRIRVVQQLPRSDAGKVTREVLVNLFTRPASDVRAEPPQLALSRVLEPHGWSLSKLQITDDELQCEVGLEPNSSRFEGHFPGQPVLPGIAQLHDLLLPVVRAAWPELEQLRQLPRVKFQKRLRGGERLWLQATRSSRTEPEHAAACCAAAGTPQEIRFVVRHADHPVCQGVLVFGEIPSPASAP